MIIGRLLFWLARELGKKRGILVPTYINIGSTPPPPHIYMYIYAVTSQYNQKSQIISTIINNMN